MPATDVLCLAGTEIANSARTIAYMTNGIRPHSLQFKDCACDDLAKFLGHVPYRKPELDIENPAPWADPAVPESFEFAGLLITGIDGLDAAPSARAVTERAGDGAVIGALRYKPRTITVNGILIGSSCCGIDYGMRWLASALRGSGDCRSPGGDDLTYLTCCPEVCEDVDDFTGYEGCAEPYWRTLRNVALTEGPTKTGVVGSNCGCCPSACPAAQVQFTLTAGRPHALLNPIAVTRPGEGWAPDDPITDCITWSDDPGCDGLDPDNCILDPVDCMAEALAAVGCPPPPPPPSVPVVANPCVCEPLFRRRHTVPIPTSDITPQWLDAVVDLEIYAGSKPLKSVRVRFYPNPLRRASVEELDPCAHCEEINIIVVPASSTIQIDGTRRRITVACPGSPETSAGPAVTGEGGGPFVWPVLECGVPYLMSVEADASSITADATITANVYAREV